MSTTDIVDFESMLSLDNPIKSSVMPRWQRKQQTGDKSDRFIPSRSGIDFENSQNMMLEESNTCEEACDSEYQKMVTSSLTNQDSSERGTRILSYKTKAPAPRDGYQNSLKVLYSQQVSKKSDLVKPARHIPSAPVRILDAPDLLDDYYLNLLSWSSTNVLAVALAQSVYLWDASSGSIKELMNVEDVANDYICSTSFIQQGGTHLAVGTASNTVQLWDVQAGKQVRSMDGHSARVGALDWNGHILSSASRDTTIINHDVRVQNHITTVMRHHSQEVCGLKWNPEGTQLASGANDNTVCIWDASHMSGEVPKHHFVEHQAAVKALAWSPHERNLLATGGGTADRSIKFWNTASGMMLNSIDTGSQVCALQWSPLEKELLSSHGYAENQLCLWNYPTMAKTKELKGHTARVLHLATSPDGSMCVSGAADETLRFWNIFASDAKKKELKNPMSAGLRQAASLKIR